MVKRINGFISIESKKTINSVKILCKLNKMNSFLVIIWIISNLIHSDFGSTRRENTIRFRIEEENKCQVIRIGNIISTDLEKLCGNKMQVFTCRAVIGDVEKIFELKYDVEGCKLDALDEFKIKLTFRRSYYYAQKN